MLSPQTLDTAGITQESTLSIGVPATTIAGHKDVTERIAREAGFQNVQTYDEPTGALVYHLHSGQLKLPDLGAGVLVVDFGGGTCDFAYLVRGKCRNAWGDWVPSGDVFVGYNVEKGLRSSDRSTDPNLMQSDWFWHEFLDRANTPFCSLIEEASKACERPLQLYLQTGPLVPNSDWARVLFDVSGSNLTPVDYNRGDGQLADVASSTDFGQLADSLRAYASGSSDWYWLDVVAGASFTLDPSGVDDTTACAAMLRPFQRWMV